jgi:hypothetical protein
MRAAASDFHGQPWCVVAMWTGDFDAWRVAGVVARLKQKVEACIGEEFAQLLELMMRVGAQLERIPPHKGERAAIWRAVLAKRCADVLRRGDPPPQSRKNRVREILESHGNELPRHESIVLRKLSSTQFVPVASC